MNNLERPIHRELYAKDLVLSKTNPRFPNPVQSEEEAILTFFQLKKVGPKKIELIIQDMFDTGVILEDFIVLQEDDKYVVYDGNRRLTALKLFIDNNSDIIKNQYKKTYDLVNTLKEEFDISKIPLSVKIYTDNDSMANHVLKIHSGQQEGIGQIAWDSNEKDSFASQHLNRPMSLGNKIYKKLENTHTVQSLYSKIQNEGYTTTFDRIFSFLDIRTRIFKLEYGQHVDVDNKVHFNKICEMIEFFISKNGNVGDVYTKDNAVAFFESIPPISGGGNRTNENTDGDIDRDNDARDNTSGSSRGSTNNTEDNNGIGIGGKTDSDANDEDPGGKRIGRTHGGRPRKKPEEYNSLIKAYHFKNIYRENTRINALIDELKKIEYKEFGLSTNFLIRSLLETYAYEYVRVFNSLDRDNPNRLKGLTLKNFTNKELHEKYFDYIANHIGTIEDEKYSTIQRQIITYFNKDNNVSVTQKLNHYIHIPDFKPSSTENLETWSVVFKILSAMDELIVLYNGQDH